MNIGILGTGMVGRTISTKLAQLGHVVVMGTRDVDKTLAHAEPDFMGNPPLNVWHQQNPQIKIRTFTDSANFGELLFNCTAGAGSLAALKMAGQDNLNGKVLIDIANPLDFSTGMPPTLSICNTDSLGEQIQRTFPEVKVVKALNTMNANLMVNPALLSNEHDVFVCGNDPAAKEQVINFLKSQLGWQSVVDLGDITNARGVEMILPMWLNLYNAFQTPLFNFKIVR